MSIKRLIQSQHLAVYSCAALMGWASPCSAFTGEDAVALQQQWAQAKYQASEEKEEAALAALQEKIDISLRKNPSQPELLIMQAVVLATKADDTDGLVQGLSDVRAARTSLLRALKLLPPTEQALANTLLGMLYYKAPPPPLSFGNNKQAASYLQKALALDPNGLEDNYYEGDYLNEQNQYQQAELFLKRALNAPADPDQPAYEQGIRQEIQAVLVEVKNHNQR